MKYLINNNNNKTIAKFEFEHDRDRCFDELNDEGEGGLIKSDN